MRLQGHAGVAYFEGGKFHFPLNQHTSAIPGMRMSAVFSVPCKAPLSVEASPHFIDQVVERLVKMPFRTSQDMVRDYHDLTQVCHFFA